MVSKAGLPPRSLDGFNRGENDFTLAKSFAVCSPSTDYCLCSHINYECAAPEAKRLRELLRAAMSAEGFAVYEPEWWHYDYKDWKEYPIMNLKFSEIK